MPPCTRTNLINAAHHLIWAESYSTVSVDDICARAGVKKGSFYHFFPSKSALAASAIEEYWQTSKPELDAVFASHLAPRERIRHFAAAALARQEEKQRETGKVCGCPYATLGAEMSAQDEHLRDTTHRLMQHFSEYFITCLRDAGLSARDASTRAPQMRMYVMGLLLAARIENSLAPIEQNLESGLLRIAGMEA